ncbi:cytidylyltransferase [Leptospira kanakyensis]|uniref:Cytidylyltransferase n=1 Tax=Leptospira kanakyensis TaxID=2484968 RepID=A0A6N4Q8D0_9LEPT|nr:cytidylyltransferase [Leptospira kanakyensis]TGK51921.1 cytidylyltransferase [Leptospira kanakyensis]TGK57171.1 cytidylyltransferase [Leptospira kanakyensis]TGK71813.1 cytidylyltransferase [Leptospira kanakyensis]
MIVALLLGRKGSIGFPGKNTFPIMGKPLAWYPMNIAKRTREIDKVYLSTDDPELKNLAMLEGVEVIDRPSHLATKEALGEHAYQHGFSVIQERNPGQTIELVVLLFCNAATVTSDTISNGIKQLRENKDADSAVTVSKYNMWSPLRARKKDFNGFLQPFVPFETFGDPKTLNCDRDSQGDVLFADMGVSIVRPQNLLHLEDGMLPQKWMGQKILPLYQEAGCDVDYEWQIPVVEWWLNKYGEFR